jgi:hypothetical protein
VKLGFISDSRKSSKLTSPVGVIAQIWLALFLGSLKMVSEPPSNARLCGTEALHDVALTRTSGICNTLVPYCEEKNNLHRVSGL